MKTTWIKIVLTGAMVAGLYACDSKDSQPPANGNPSAESGAPGDAGKQTRILQVKVATDGKITLDDQAVTVEELGKGISDAKAAGPCGVWYYREKTAGPTPEFVKPIIEVFKATNVPVVIAEKADFSDLIAKAQARAQAANRVNPADAMRELRRSTLADGPAKIGIQPTKDFARTYGVIMDFPLGTPDHPVVGSLVALGNGDSSLLSTANLFIPGGQDSTRNAVTNFVMAVDANYDDAAPATEFPYPLPGRVRFYLMTFQGVRVIDTDVESLANGKGKYANLFTVAQAVLVELRKTTGATQPASTQPASTQAGPTSAAPTSASNTKPAGMPPGANEAKPLDEAPTK